jgi:hypothetical protein
MSWRRRVEREREANRHRKRGDDGGKKKDTKSFPREAHVYESRLRQAKLQALCHSSLVRRAWFGCMRLLWKTA